LLIELNHLRIQRRRKTYRMKNESHVNEKRAIHATERELDVCHGFVSLGVTVMGRSLEVGGAGAFFREPPCREFFSSTALAMTSAKRHMSPGPLRSYRCVKLFDASRFEPHITVKYHKLLDCESAGRPSATCWKWYGHTTADRAK